MSEATNLQLQYPLESGITHITLRRPKVRDMLASDKAKGSDAEKEIALFANLCEVAPVDIEALDMADYQALQKAYQGFLS
ncbi:MAG: phage tail assembly protein [Methylobacter sp.]